MSGRFSSWLAWMVWRSIINAFRWFSKCAAILISNVCGAGRAGNFQRRQFPAGDDNHLNVSADDENEQSDDISDRLRGTRLTSLERVQGAVVKTASKIEGLKRQPALRQVRDLRQCWQRRLSDSVLATDLAEVRERVGFLHDTVINMKRQKEKSFVVFGLDETPDEDALAVVKTLLVEVGADVTKIIAAERLSGRTKVEREPNTRSKRPRLIRVYTSSPKACQQILRQRRKFMAMQPPNNRIFLNEYLGREELSRLRTLLPVYRQIKRSGVPCRMDRDRIMVGEDLVLRDLAAAQQYLNSRLESLPSREQTQEIDESSSSRPTW